MFNESFYPTPHELAIKLVSSYELKNKIILEPSAGKGDILKVLPRESVKHFLEIESELQAISSQYATMVGDDFLQFEPDTRYDFIFMNPPFSNGEDHLIKAINIGNNTQIACILNAETIRNPYSKKRQALLEIIKQHGSVEYIQDAFLNAERKTGVEIAIVRIHVPKTSTSFLDGTKFEAEETREYKPIQETGLETQDKIGNIIEDFKRIQEYYTAGYQLIERADSIAKQYTMHPEGFKHASDREGPYKYINNIKTKIWHSILDALKINKFMTSKVRDEFMEKMKTQGGMAINRNNINMFISTIMQNGGDILEASIVQAFELLTKYDEKNKMIPEGWKHNASYMVNRKFILPCIDQYKDWSGKVSINYYHLGQLEDIERALCYVSGKEFKNELCKAIRSMDYDSIGDSEFFTMKAYKKGTVHFTFKDEALWMNFNLRATKSKGWLPVDYKWKQSNKF